MTIKHKIYKEKTKEKTKTFIWKLALDYDNKPQLLVSDDGGTIFSEVLTLYKNGKWTTYSSLYLGLIRKHPDVFAKRDSDPTGRTLCMWDEKSTKE